MQAWEMNKKAKDSISAKLRAYHGEPKVIEPQERYGSYDEAKKAAEAAAKEGHNNHYAQESMVSHKLRAYRGVSYRDQLYKRTEEYGKLGIMEIQKRHKAATQNKAELKRYLDNIITKQEERYRKEYKDLTHFNFDDAVYEAMEEWRKTDKNYLEVKAEYEEAKLDTQALQNAIDDFKVRNADLIEAAAEEKRKAEIEAYLASQEDAQGEE